MQVIVSRLYEKEPIESKEKTLKQAMADDRHVILASNVHARGNTGRGEGVKGGREEWG